MGHRLSADQRRHSILDAATDAFAQGSYRSVGTAAVARAAATSEATLFKHFSTKQALFVATLGHAADLLGAALREARDVGGVEDPDRWLDLVTDAITQNGAATRVLFQAAAEGNSAEIRAAAWEAVSGIVSEFASNLGAFTERRSDAVTGAWWAFSQYLLLFYLEAIGAADRRIPRRALSEMRRGLLEWIEAR